MGEEGQDGLLQHVVVVVDLAVVLLQVADYRVHLELGLKAVVLAQLAHLIFKLLLLQVDGLLLLSLLLALLLFLGLLLPLFLQFLPLLVVPDESCRFVEADQHEAHDGHKHVLLHVLGDVVQESLGLYLEELQQLAC